MLSTTDLIFGAQLEGTRSAAQLVTLTNSGPVTLTISSITASGDFLQKNNCGSTTSRVSRSIAFHYTRMQFGQAP